MVALSHLYFVIFPELCFDQVVKCQEKIRWSYFFILIGVPIENLCVKGGGLLYGGFVTFVFCHICIVSFFLSCVLTML